MLTILKKAYTWTKLNFKWVLLALFGLLCAFLGITFVRRGKKIDKLQQEIYMLKAKLKMEKLAVKHDILVDQLIDLKEQDAATALELEKIEEALKEKLPDDMSMEEMAEKFKELGLR